MSDNDLVGRLVYEPVLWVQTEEDSITSWQGLGDRSDIDVLTITSGGCTPLTFLSLGARNVISVDVNPSQTMILEFKRAAINTMDRHDVLALLGVVDIRGNEERYQRLRSVLPRDAQIYWDKNMQSFVQQRLIETGGMQGVGSELQVTAYEHYRTLENLFDSMNLQEQIASYENSVTGLVEWKVAQLRQQRAEKYFGADDAPSDDDEQVADEMRQAFISRLRRAVHTFLLQSSPYATHMFLGCYKGEVLPYYLTTQGFAITKEKLSRLRTYTGDVASLVDSLETDSLDGADISNVADLFSRNEFEDLCQRFRRVLRLGGRLVHRNLVWPEPYPVATGFIRDEAVSIKLSATDKSVLYSAITVDVIAY